MKLKIVRLIKDWKENSDGPIGCYGVEHEVIPTASMNMGYRMSKRGLTDWKFEANATTCLSPAVDEGSTESIDRMWYYTCVRSCRAKEYDQEHEVWRKDETIPVPL